MTRRWPRILLVTVLLVLVLISLAFFGVVRGRLLALDFKRLDDWVEHWEMLGKSGTSTVILGGQFEYEVNEVVVPTCGKLVLASASVWENIRFLTDSRSSYWRLGGSYQFRMDVCTKVTVNRVGKQPDINPATVHLICDESRIALFATLCKRSGLR